MRRRRWRTAVLWGGCTLCVLIAVAFVASGWWMLVVQIPTPYGPAVGVNGGLFGLILDEPWSVLFVAERGGTWAMGPWEWKPLWSWWNTWDVGRRFVNVPLYAVFLFVAIPTLAVWWFGRNRVKPGHCECGYNLTGLPKTRCPECGRTFGSKRRRGTRRRSGLLRVAKRGGVVVCVAVAVSWIVSGWFYVGWCTNSGFASINARSVRVEVFDHRSQGMTGLLIGRTISRSSGWFPQVISQRYHSVRIGNKVSRMRGTLYVIPIWLLLLATGIPTIILCRLDNRPILGHCRCGYDLTGNVSGTCPECGRESEQSAKPPRGEGLVSRVRRISRERDDADH